MEGVAEPTVPGFDIIVNGFGSGAVLGSYDIGIFSETMTPLGLLF